MTTENNANYTSTREGEGPLFGMLFEEEPEYDGSCIRVSARVREIDIFKKLSLPVYGAIGALGHRSVKEIETAAKRIEVAINERIDYLINKEEEELLLVVSLLDQPQDELPQELPEDPAKDEWDEFFRRRVILTGYSQSLESEDFESIWMRTSDDYNRLDVLSELVDLKCYSGFKFDDFGLVDFKDYELFAVYTLMCIWEMCKNNSKFVAENNFHEHVISIGRDTMDSLYAFSFMEKMKVEYRFCAGSPELVQSEVDARVAERMRQELKRTKKKSAEEGSSGGYKSNRRGNEMKEWALKLAMLMPDSKKNPDIARELAGRLPERFSNLLVDPARAIREYLNIHRK